MRYIHVTKAVKRLICTSEQNMFKHMHYGVASAKLFMLVQVQKQPLGRNLDISDFLVEIFHLIAFSESWL